MLDSKGSPGDLNLPLFGDRRLGHIHGNDDTRKQEKRPSILYRGERRGQLMMRPSFFGRLTPRPVAVARLQTLVELVALFRRFVRISLGVGEPFNAGERQPFPVLGLVVLLLLLEIGVVRSPDLLVS